MIDDFPYAGTAAERAEYIRNYRPAPKSQVANMLETARAGAASARLLAEKLRNRNRTPTEEREFQRLNAYAEEQDAKVKAIEDAEAKRRKFEADPAAKVAREHLDPFRRLHPDHAADAEAALADFDLAQFWRVVRRAEDDEFKRLDRSRSDAELNKLKADAEAAKAELAAIEAEHRLNELP